MSTYVLVHGAFEGGWVWDKVVPLIENGGHRVLAPDLPGHGGDKTPTTEVTLQLYVDRICAVLDAQPEPVILVGHSMAGVVITQVAEHRPHRIRKLVYLAAFLPQDGQSAGDFREADSLTEKNIILADDDRTFTVRQEANQEINFEDCPAEDVARAKTLSVPQAIAPLVTAVKTTSKNFGRVPRVYITCLKDKALSPEMQKKMYTALVCEKVITMDTSHFPLFSAPDALADHLMAL